MLQTFCNGLILPCRKFLGKVRKRFVEFLSEHRQRLAQVTQNFQVGLNIFIYLGGVKLEVNDLGVRRKILDAPRHSVAETHSDTQQQVATLNRHVRAVGAVHTRKAQKSFRVRVNAPQAHKR